MFGLFPHNRLLVKHRARRTEHEKEDTQYPRKITDPMEKGSMKHPVYRIPY